MCRMVTRPLCGPLNMAKFPQWSCFWTGGQTSTTRIWWDSVKMNATCLSITIFSFFHLTWMRKSANSLLTQDMQLNTWILQLGHTALEEARYYKMDDAAAFLTKWETARNILLTTTQAQPLTESEQTTTQPQPFPESEPLTRRKWAVNNKAIFPNTVALVLVLSKENKEI